MQTVRTAQPSVRSTPARSAIKCNATQQQVKVVPRRELLSAGATFAALLIGAGAAQAAGESSATRAITNVTRPQQLKKKEENREALKEQIEKVRQGEADPKSLP
jgi:uncharacterized protein YdeI (YjbR/CyaY-like superfamily)